MLDNEEVRRHLDFSRPVALLQVGTLHHYAGDDGAELMRQYIDVLPAGSFVVVAHFFDPETDELSPLARRMEQVFVHSPMRSGAFRTHAQITGFLPDLDISHRAPTDRVSLSCVTCGGPTGPDCAR